MTYSSAIKSSLVVTLSAIILGSGCHAGPTDIDGCTALVGKYQTDLANICRGEPTAWRAQSGFCSVCEKNGLFSYVKTPGGQCTCEPLTITDSVCAGDEDTGKLLAAIIAADAECATYSIDRVDAGTPDPNTSDAGVSDAGMSDAGMSDATTD